MGIRGFVLGTYRVVRAKLTCFQSRTDYFMNLPAELYEPSQGTLRIRCACIQKHPITNLRNGVDTFANRTSRICGRIPF